ncbi:MAG TPA: indole-3-glycerol phosphate synthase TrpC [Phycisphaerae bacterium]|nr:indole-3-glycerol phosphate synthase TrpC [Phycisphaerae bacterium]
MPSILDRILAVKRREVTDLAPRVTDLKAAAAQAPPARGLATALRRPHGAAIRVMAEVKHRSPSAGVICDPFVPADIARAYEQGGADAVSCLTDAEFFGGSIDHLREVRAAVGLPVLRKDFLIAPVQVYEARAAGADGVLLIAEALDAAAMRDLAALAADLGMDVLAEAHSEAMLEKAVACGAPLVGINNRDLATFAVDLATTERLAARVCAAGRVLVAESGIRTAADVSRLLACGCDAILVGEGLLKAGMDVGRGAPRPRLSTVAMVAAKLAEFGGAT